MLEGIVKEMDNAGGKIKYRWTKTTLIVEFTNVIRNGNWTGAVIYKVANGKLIYIDTITKGKQNV